MTIFYGLCAVVPGLVLWALPEGSYKLVIIGAQFMALIAYAYQMFNN